MPGQTTASTDVFVNQQITSAREHLGAAEHGKALEILEPLLAQGAPSHAIYEAAARALTTTIIDGAFPADWPPARRIAFCRRLIIEHGRSGTPPALAAQIAAAHAGGTPAALEKAARALEPTLSAMWDEGDRGTPLLVIVLLLRGSLEAWRDQAEISRWHIDRLPDLDRHEMTIPYNDMFDAQSFKRNIGDITKLIETTTPADLVRRFTRWQLILFHWITGSEAYDGALPAILAELRTGADEAALEMDDRTASRSLTVRRAALGHGPATPAALLDALGDELAGLATPWRALHGTPQNSDPGAKAKARIASRSQQASQLLLGMAKQRAPFLRLGRRRPRVAVCISGQLRGYRAALPTWQAGLLRDVDCQFVVHSWEKIGRSGAEPFRAYLPFSGASFCEAWRTHGHRVGIDILKQRYPQLFLALQQGAVVSARELGEFYGTDHVVLEDDSDAYFDGWSNGHKMHYKIAAASSLLERADLDVDLVLRVRPDKALGMTAFGWSDLLKAAQLSPTLFADAGMGHQFGRLMIGDQVALASREVMDVYADTLNLAPRLGEAQLFLCDDGFRGHVSLALTCWHAGIDVQRLPVRMGDLLEAAPMATSETAAALDADTVGRMDAMDTALITAIRADISAGTA